MRTTPTDAPSVAPARSAAALAALPGPGATRIATRSPWAAWAMAGGALIALALALRAWAPGDDPGQTLCLFRQLTHHDCATCGMTRALAHLARGDVRGAMARHPLALPLAAEALALWLAAPLAIARGWRPSGAWRDRALLAHASAFLGVWLVRLLA
jgi:hypothetical protein